MFRSRTLSATEGIFFIDGVHLYQDSRCELETLVLDTIFNGFTSFTLLPILKNVTSTSHLLAPLNYQTCISLNHFYRNRVTIFVSPLPCQSF